MKTVSTLNFFLLGLSLVSFFHGDVVTAQETSNITALKKTLEKEFTRSYPENPIRQGETKTFDLIASESQWGIFPPYQTDVWAYNGKIPGPVIRIKLGETLKVRFTNQLPQSTSIHWHGVRVPNAMDGVPGVTQPPIPSGGSFTYEFTPKDAGTFWFHPHVNTAEQIERGLHGVLIVEDENEPEYSRDLVLVLDDWLLEKGAKIHSKFVTRHDLSHDGRWGNVLTINGRFLPSIPVIAGERIRLRLINVANGRVFSPQFPELSSLVIAVDGMLTGEPFPLKRFLLAPGNRIDVDMIIPETLAGKKLKILNTFSKKHTPIAFLQVESDKTVETPRFKPPQAAHFPNWNEALNVPYSYEFKLDGKRGGPYGISWTINDKAWPDSTPHELEFGRYTRLRLTNTSPRMHPMHLHGQFFRVITRNGKTVHENYWRDTVLLGRKETVDIALIPVDKGLWAHHCHILEHAEAGMMSVVKVK